MPELHVIRHGQASFGAADYDVLSELGHRQAEALGRSLKVQGVAPVRFAVGEQRRHRETLDGIARGLGIAARPVIHPGLNEFDFRGLIEARHRDAPVPEEVHSDRKSHFRILRDTVLAWARDEVPGPPETYAAFAARVADALAVLATGDGPVLAVSSGGPISRMIAATLGTPPEMQIALQLQMKNCAVTRFVATPKATYLHGYNETPHITAATAEFLTYS